MYIVKRCTQKKKNIIIIRIINSYRLENYILKCFCLFFPINGGTKNRNVEYIVAILCIIIFHTRSETCKVPWSEADWDQKASVKSIHCGRKPIRGLLALELI
jgi:hypothetical protein